MKVLVAFVYMECYNAKMGMGSRACDRLSRPHESRSNRGKRPPFRLNRYSRESEVLI